MNDPNELKELVDIGLITGVSGIFRLGSREGDQPATAAIRVQMESLSGKIYFASLTIENHRGSPEYGFRAFKLGANPRFPVSHAAFT
jgi:hypothetical protein